MDERLIQHAAVNGDCLLHAAAAAAAIVAAEADERRCVLME